MPRLENIRIQTGNPGDKNANHRIDATQGYLNSSHRFSDNTYEIQDYVVWGTHRKQGYGKELLQIALQHARALGARAVTASYIATRESVDAVSTVFGPDSVTIEWLGDYAPEGGEPQSSAQASLAFEIPGTDQDDNEYEQLVADALQSIHPTVRAFNEDITTLNERLRTLDEEWGNRFWQLSEDQQQTYQALHELRHLLMEARDRTERRLDDEK